MVIHNNRIQYIWIKVLIFWSIVVIIILSNWKLSWANSITVLRNINNEVNEVPLYNSSFGYIRLQQNDFLQTNYFIAYSNGHFTVKTLAKNKNFTYDSATGSNGAALQAINTCFINATDNCFYLNSIGPDDKNQIIYSDFSKKLHGSKYIRLFYYTLEMYALSKYANNTLESNINDFLYTLKIDNPQINIINEENFKRYFKQIFKVYGLNSLDIELTQVELKKYIYKLFTDIKSELGLTGEFDPLLDTPNLIPLLEERQLTTEEIANIKENFKGDIKKNPEKSSKKDVEKDLKKNITKNLKKINDINLIINLWHIKYIYEITNKTPNSFYYINNIKHNGYYITLDYNNRNNKTYNGYEINFSTGYESSKDYFHYGINLGIENMDLKYYKKLNNLDIISYFKLEPKKIPSLIFGFHVKTIFNNNMNSNNYINGYFAGLYKKLDISNKSYLKLSSTLFDTSAKLNNLKMFGNTLFNNKMHYNNLYVENAIEFDIEYFTFNGFNLSFVPTLKYDANLNNNKNTHITFKNSEIIVDIKNENRFYVSLLNNITFKDNIFTLGADLFKDNYEIYVKFIKTF